MRTIVALLLVLFAAQCTAADTAFAAKEKKGSKTTLADQEEARRLELENTQWELNLLPRDPKAKGPLTDTLTFKGGKMVFKAFEAKGFVPAGYTLTAFTEHEGGRWETFQTQGDKTLSGRGDWFGERMDGVISMTSDGGKKVETYNFSTSKKSVLPPDAPESEAAAPTEPETVAAAPTMGSALVSKEAAAPSSKKKK